MQEDKINTKIVEVESYENLEKREDGWYVSRDTGKIWGSVEMICDKIDIMSVTTFRRYAKDLPFVVGPMNLRLYDFEEAKIHFKEYLSRQKLDEGTLVFEEDGRRYASQAYFAKKYDVGGGYLYRLMEKISYKEGRTSKGVAARLFDIGEFEENYRDFIKRKKVNKEGIYIDEVGRRYSYAKFFRRKYNLGEATFNRLVSGMEILPGRNTVGECNLYDIDIFEKRNKEYLDLVIIPDNVRIYTDSHGIRWTYQRYFRDEYNIQSDKFKDLVENKVPSILARGKAEGGKIKLYDLDKALIALGDIVMKKETSGEDGMYVDKDGQKWGTQNYFKMRYGISRSSFLSKVDGLKKIEGINDHTNHQSDLYKIDEVVEILGEEFLSRYSEEKETSIFIDDEGCEWAAIGFFSMKYGIDKKIFQEKIHYTKTRCDNSPHGTTIELFLIDEVSPLIENFISKIIVNDEGIFLDGEGSRWGTFEYFVKKYREITKAIINKYALLVSSLPYGKGKSLYNVSVLEPLLVGYQNLLDHKVDSSTDIYTDKDGTKWCTKKKLLSFFELSSQSVLNSFLQGLTPLPGISHGLEVELYKLTEVAQLYEEYKKKPRSDKEGIYIDVNGVKWVTGVYFLREFPFIKHYSRLTTITENSERLEGIFNFKGVGVTHYNLEEATNLIREFLKLPGVDTQSNTHVDDTGTTWGPASYFVETFNLPGYSSFLQRVKGFHFIYGRDRRNYKTKFYRIKDFIKLNYEDQKTKVKNSFEIFINELIEGKTFDSKRFWLFVNIFGSSHAADILFKFRPEFKGLPVEYVKGIMAEYFGDTLSNPGKFKPADIKEVVELLSETTFQDALFETIKENCLKYYFEQKQQGGSEYNGYEVIYSYIDHLFKEIGEVKNERLDDIVQKVVEYYDSVLRHFHKPEGFVDKLSAGREFPDINQRINMKELQEKKRLLIADEMGLGKSASVIMAKEQLGVKCAVIVAPSNVIDTWQRYLSDEKTPGGYFQEGKAPRVLRVENVKDLQGITADQYDYILLSQGLLKSNYVQHLKKIDYDMMIVDEVHKLKRMDGKRSEALLELSSKIQGEDKYLALLSGTPVPNKVKDLAINLKLLYPEKFADYDNNELVYQIINGDIIDLRSLLIPRMQMKSLEDGVELPPMTEETIKIELSELEKEVYEVLLEDDEVTPTEKIQILRQFLLNPELVDATPGLESAKQNKLSERLSEAFAKEDKILMFVNGYVGNVIHGEKSIFNSVQIPPGVELRFVYGDVEGKERTRIQDEFNTSNKKILLVVSGQTADVGVDYSAAQRVIFYNEPWTVYDKKQQISRAYRQGLKHPLQVDTFITDLTIEEGMQEYIERKFVAIEKLLRGVPVTELEKELLKSGEKTNEDDASVDPDFAKYYFSSLDRILRFFGYVREKGEENFKKFLTEHGGEYAGAYIDLGSRSYQANANRVAGTLMHEFIETRGLSDTERKEMKILDMASGPEMLKHHIADKYQDNVVSIDINKEHFKKGAVAAVGSILALPFASESFDYANFALSLHYTNFVPSKGRLERLQALMEMNRVLKVGGRGVVNMVYSLDFKDFDKFKEVVAEAGFQVVEEYTGEAELGDSYKSTVITLEKIRSLGKDVTVESVNDKLTAEKREGLKFKSNKKKLKDSRRVLTEFSLNGKSYKTKLNKEDIEIFVEEQQIIKQGETLKKAYEGKIENIPRAQVLSNGFVRIRPGKKYVLFKKMIRGSGVVIVK